MYWNYYEITPKSNEITRNLITCNQYRTSLLSRILVTIFGALLVNDLPEMCLLSALSLPLFQCRCFAPCPEVSQWYVCQWQTAGTKGRSTQYPLLILCLYCVIVRELTLDYVKSHSNISGSSFARDIQSTDVLAIRNITYETANKGFCVNRP